MPEKAEPVRTGSRDDLCLEASRCLRVRFSESRCGHCLAVCPAEAVSLDDGLELDSNRCSGCLLCTSVCPSGALELSSDFLACLAQLSKVSEPVLGCCRTKEQANGWLACLGGLSPEHLLILSHRLTGRLTLNISRCSDCPNNSMLPQLQTRLAELSGPASGAGGCRITAVDTADAVRHREETVDRRSFFKSFRTSLFQTAAVVMSAGAQETERRSDYNAKRLPARRELLQRILDTAGPAGRKTLEDRYFGNISFTPACTACQACAAICPTGALEKNREDLDSPPVFKPAACTACGLCVEFCMDRAIIPLNFQAQQRLPDEPDEPDETVYPDTEE